jgi:hypothetical protein
MEPTSEQMTEFLRAMERMLAEMKVEKELTE